MFSSILGFDPVFLPEAQRYADDDFMLEYEQRENRGHPDDCEPEEE